MLTSKDLSLVVFCTLIALSLFGCQGGSTDGGAASGPTTNSGQGSTGSSQACTQPPKVDKSLPWPVIHQGDKAHKAAPGAGPVSDDLIIDHWEGLPAIVSVTGKEYLYQQSAGSPVLKMFELTNLSQGPVAEIILPGIWPAAGGGVVDTCGHTWWNATDHLYRTNADFTEVVESERLGVQLDEEQGLEGGPGILTNAVNLLPDGNVMVSTMQQWVFMLSHETNEDGVFPVLDTIDLRKH